MIFTVYRYRVYALQLALFVLLINTAYFIHDMRLIAWLPTAYLLYWTVDFRRWALFIDGINTRHAIGFHWVGSPGKKEFAKIFQKPENARAPLEVQIQRLLSFAIGPLILAVVFLFGLTHRLAF